MCYYYYFLLILFSFITLLIYLDIKYYQIGQIKQIEQIEQIDNFISLSECDKLIKLAENRYTNSTVYVQTHGSVDTNARSSSCAYFKRGENSLIKKIESKVSKMFSIDRMQIEPIQIVKYEKGQQYKYHYDYFASNSDQINNQRVYSILIYLNDLDELDGGTTDFPYYKLKIQPQKGKCIYWKNTNLDNSVNKLTLHAGKPILTNKIKYVLTIWTREFFY